MSFESDLIADLGDDTADHDIRVAVRRCYFFDFDGYPTRLWQGQGVLVAGGYEWLGTLDADGNDFLRTDVIQDSRDGTSPRYTFGIPYVDAATFDALKADQALVAGREMTRYAARIAPGEGLRPATSLRFTGRFLMVGAEFSQRRGGEAPSITRVRSASVVARSLEYGRSRMPNGTYTDTAQQERARLLGLASDSGCSFVARNARRTYEIR